MVQNATDKLQKQYDKLNLEMIYMGQSFERYFSGKDNVPPVIKLKNYKTKVKNFTQEKFKDNALKFKAGNLYQKLLAYEANWNKKLRMIEIGMSDNKKKPVSVKKKTTQSKEHIEKTPEELLYDKFVESQNKVSGKVIDKEKFIQNIYAQKKKLEEQNKINDVWFKVIVKDGKTTIKAYRKDS